MKKEETDKVKEMVRKILINQYIHNNVKLSFWKLEQYLIRAGFNFYLDKEGNKKLSIRYTIKPYYKNTMKYLDNIKKDRDITVEILDNLIDKYKKDEVRYSYLQKFLRENKQFLTSKDLEFYRKLIYELKSNKKDKVVL